MSVEFRRPSGKVRAKLKPCALFKHVETAFVQQYGTVLYMIRELSGGRSIG